MISKSPNSGGSEGGFAPFPAFPKKDNSGDKPKYLAPNGGRKDGPSWQEMPDFSEILSRISSLESRADALDARLDSASIDAQCQNGTVTVTLNL